MNYVVEHAYIGNRHQYLHRCFDVYTIILIYAY